MKIDSPVKPANDGMGEMNGMGNESGLHPQPAFIQGKSD